MLLTLFKTKRYKWQLFIYADRSPYTKNWNIGFEFGRFLA